MAKTDVFHRCWQAVLVVLPFSLLLGCAAPMPSAKPALSSEAACLAWYRAFDAVLADRDLGDPSAYKIPDFPFLRTDRFLASYRLQPLTGAAFADWLERMRRLDAALRTLEAANLAPADRLSLRASAPLHGTLDASLEQCGRRLVGSALQKPETRTRLRQTAQVPDNYRLWQRIAGAYWLMQYPAKAALKKLHRKLAETFVAPLEGLPVRGALLRYAPAPNVQLSEKNIAGLLSKAAQNPLGIPDLEPESLTKLFDHFAPVWEIDTRNSTDRIGDVYLTRTGRPQVATWRPVVYRKAAYTRWHGRVLLQLVYQIWLPAREKEGPADPYGGDLDSVLWRVTLGLNGVPVAYDSIHGCGCYYLLFPGEGFASVPPNDGAEAVLSPKTLAAAPGRRLLLRLEARTHYLQQTASIPADAAAEDLVYRLKDDDALLSLPMPDGARRSAFGTDGLIDASVRAERFVLWPFGVPSPGAMRQWGTHAIAFTGRRHFDDPGLIENLIAASPVKPEKPGPASGR